MTIHSDHPFETPEDQRSQVRRWRGRLSAPVTIATTGSGKARAGLTVSSLNIIEGEPAYVVLWIDPDSDLADVLAPGSKLAITQLTKGDEYQAEAFAGLVPAPGGPFTLGDWIDGDYGPVLVDHTHLGGTVTDLNDLGWSRQVTAQIDYLAFREHAVLSHVRGNFQ